MAVGNTKWYSHFGGQFGSLTKLNILLPCDPVILSLGAHPEKLKTHVQAKTCIQVFIVALFMIAKT